MLSLLAGLASTAGSLTTGRVSLTTGRVSLTTARRACVIGVLAGVEVLVARCEARLACFGAMAERRDERRGGVVERVFGVAAAMDWARRGALGSSSPGNTRWSGVVVSLDC